MTHVENLLRGKHLITTDELRDLGSSEINELSEIATDMTSEANRARAISVLGRSGAATAVETLTRIARNSDDAPAVRAIAITELGRLDPQSGGASVLAELAVSDDPLLSTKALLGLARSGTSTEYALTSEPKPSRDPTEHPTEFARIAIAARERIDVLLPTPRDELRDKGRPIPAALEDVSPAERHQVADWIVGDTFGLEIDACTCLWVTCARRRLFLAIDRDVAISPGDIDSIRLGALVAFPNEADGSYSTKYLAYVGPSEGAGMVLAVFRTDGSLRFLGPVRTKDDVFEISADRVAKAVNEPEGFLAIGGHGVLEELRVADAISPENRAQPEEIDGP